MIAWNRPQHTFKEHIIAWCITIGINVLLIFIGLWSRVPDKWKEKINQWVAQ
jgi:hypothetical protein